ncbi:TRAP transporter small permease [Oscillibacter sp.]|uniref:TRAP transporter small permease n=1 Tax=Oscillibacter sp. TaxID=1945593 RepID=UPI0028A1B10A|nr:TRAP transporter small permease [Oscillibacter sp.]
MKALKWLDDHFEESILVILLVVISCVSLIQVIIRNIPWIPSLQWAEEFCRFCWIWSVFISLPYTIRKGNMLRVSVLLDLLSGFLRKVINILVDLVTTGSMALLAVYSVTVVKNVMSSGEASPAMLWPMWIVYIVMLIGFALGTVRGLQQAIIHVIHFKEKELTTLEQTMQDAAEEAELAKGEKGAGE